MKNCFIYEQSEKERLIASLTTHLPVLRATASISQEQLAAAIDISRQTYSAIETQKKQMSWNIYMSLILYFNSNEKTKTMLHTIVDVPDEIML